MIDTSKLNPAVAALVQAAADKAKRDGNVTRLVDGFTHYAATKEQADDFRRRANKESNQ